jgi:hypothetical protein
VVRLIYTYFNYRGDHILSVIDNGLEADDYVGHIIEKYPDKNIALYTTDMDWARYLSKKVCIIDSSFDDPFSDTDFKKKYGYYYGYGRYGKYGRYGRYNSRYGRYGNYGSYGSYGTYGSYGNYSNSHYGDKNDTSVKR